MSSNEDKPIGDALYRDALWQAYVNIMNSAANIYVETTGEDLPEYNKDEETNDKFYSIVRCVCIATLTVIRDLPDFQWVGESLKDGSESDQAVYAFMERWGEMLENLLIERVSGGSNTVH